MSKILRSFRRFYTKKQTIFRGPMLRATKGPQPKYEDEIELTQEPADPTNTGILLPDYIEKKCVRAISAEEGANMKTRGYNLPYHSYSFYDLHCNTVRVAALAAEKLKQKKCSSVKKPEEVGVEPVEQKAKEQNN